uniref:TGF-beta family profile domain-containing protein n=1 Tax=Anolis carolinensis TaxID=28377 RepID=H9GAV5_ANOCA|nr:PREDICTED: bone morphogenetic protein 15 [Anolis carolinensis]|eukprot:XP_008122791.1 PREDICTED: bone morphogenetic protein 15 [Anolis carolinensis]
MAGWSPLFPCGALLLLATLLLLLEPPLGHGREAPASHSGALAGAPPLPLIRVLLSQGPPKARPLGRRRRQAGQQPLRYMMSLYRSLADRHGRPRRDRQMPTNTVRLVQPFAKRLQPGTGPWLVWTLDYRLEVKPQVEQLVRAVAIYSRTQLSNSSLFACAAELLQGQRASSPTPLSLNLVPPQDHLNVTMAPPAQDSWAEVDLSAHLPLWGSWEAPQSRVLRLRHACAASSSSVGHPLDPAAVSLEDPFLLLYLNDTRQGLRAERDEGPNPALGLSPLKPSRGSPSLVRRARQAGRLALDLPGYSRPGSSKRDEECSLRPFRVSFSQLGWDHWIIAPHWYRPQFCKGDCPRVLRHSYHAPNHAIVQNFINELVDSSVPRPSCVPYEYGPISVLMIEPNNDILYKVYDNMVAKSCTCR